MALICDAHVHLYSLYNLRRAFEHAVSNLNFIAANAGLPSDAQRALVLTERYDCRYFEALTRNGGHSREDFAVRSTGDPSAAIVELAGGEELTLIAGRQIVTQERLELLGLCMSAPVPDGLPFKQAQSRVLEAGGLPVLNWAPGKWLFRRGKLVKEILASADTRTLLVCDTWLRPAAWGEPVLMQLARLRGITVIAGSDPLPFDGEELRIGSYGIASMEPFDAAAPCASLRKILLECGDGLVLAGSRGSSAEVVGRLYKHHTVGKRHRDAAPDPVQEQVSDGA